MKLYPVYCDCSGEREAFTEVPAAAKEVRCPNCGTWVKPEVPRECSE